MPVDGTPEQSDNYRVYSPVEGDRGGFEETKDPILNWGVEQNATADR